MNRYQEMYPVMVKQLGERRAAELFQELVDALAELAAARIKERMLEPVGLEDAVMPRESETLTMRDLSIVGTKIRTFVPELEKSTLLSATYRQNDFKIIFHELAELFSGR